MGKPRIRASVVCEAEGHLLLVQLRDPTTKAVHYYPPGGGIEPGESPAQTAERETLEETGLHVRVEPSLELVDRYPFTWDGVDYDCTTHYLAATLINEAVGRFDPAIAPVKDAAYHEGAAWLPSEKGLQELAVHPRIGAAVSRLLGRARRFAWHRDPELPDDVQTLIAVNDGLRSTAERLRTILEREPQLDLAWMIRMFEPLANLVRQPSHAALQPEVDAAIAGLRTAATHSDALFVLRRFEDNLTDFLDRNEGRLIPAHLGKRN